MKSSFFPQMEVFEQLGSIGKTSTNCFKTNDSTRTNTHPLQGSNDSYSIQRTRHHDSLGGIQSTSLCRTLGNRQSGLGVELRHVDPQSKHSLGEKCAGCKVGDRDIRFAQDNRDWNAIIGLGLLHLPECIFRLFEDRFLGRLGFLDILAVLLLLFPIDARSCGLETHTFLKINTRSTSLPLDATAQRRCSGLCKTLVRNTWLNTSAIPTNQVDTSGSSRNLPSSSARTLSRQ
jgi:hypothetical protein